MCETCKWLHFAKKTAGERVPSEKRENALRRVLVHNISSCVDWRADTNSDADSAEYCGSPESVLRSKPFPPAPPDGLSYRIWFGRNFGRIFGYDFVSSEDQR